MQYLYYDIQANKYTGVDFYRNVLPLEQLYFAFNKQKENSLQGVFVAIITSEFKATDHRYIRIIRYGNSKNKWNNVCKVAIYGKDTVTSINRKLSNKKSTGFFLVSYLTPFNPNVTIRYSLPVAEYVESVYKIHWRKILELYRDDKIVGHIQIVLRRKFPAEIIF